MARMRDRWLPLVLVLAHFVGCTPSDREGAEGAEGAEGIRTSMDTVGGIEHLRNSGATAPLHLEHALMLGALEGGAEQFGRIRSVVADEAGDIYVADNIASEVRVFAADGSHRTTFGRNGAGPGEFGNLYGMAWVDERLAVMDPGNARIGLFSRDGAWLDQWTYFPLTGSALSVRPHPDGTSGFYAAVLGAGGGRLPYARFGAEGQGEQVVRHPSPPEDAGGSGVLCHRPDGGITSISIPGAPQLLLAFAPGSLRAVSWTASYRIAFLDAADDTVRVVENERASVALSDEEWEDGMRPYRELRERFPGADCDPRAPVRPDSKGALRHLLFDAEGRMWAEAWTSNGLAWDIFDRDGRLVGSAPAPERQAGVPPYVRGDRLYQVEVDELGVQYVSVYRLTGG